MCSVGCIDLFSMGSVQVFFVLLVFESKVLILTALN